LRPADSRWAQALGGWACCAPLFVLTVRGWSNWVLFSSGLAALALLVWGPAAPPAKASPEVRRLARLVIAALLAPLLAVALSSLLRLDWHSADFDAPSRFWAAIPVFLVAWRWRLDPARWLRVTLPAGLAITLAQQYLEPQPRWWTPARMSTYFADPLVFGYISLAFALMCLMSITPQRRREPPAWVDALLVAALPLGLYLSVQSGSRTGWLAIPIVLAIWLQRNVRVAHRWGRAVLPLAVVLVACSAAAAAYQLIPRVNARVQEAVGDVTSYSFAGVAPVSPVGLRITYLRIAGDLFTRHPFAGVGDTSKQDPVPASAFPYASAGAVDTAFRSGMHNQVVTNTVRFGIAGGITAALLLIAPVVVFARRSRSPAAVARANAAMGLAFAVTIAICSLTTEVVDLKYTASFYALMTALLCGACLASHGQD
jgi:O-antigen ligase